MGAFWSRTAPRSSASDGLDAYWTLERDELATRLASTSEGLTSREAERRLGRVGRNQLDKGGSPSRLRMLSAQLESPLLLLLLFAAGVSGLSGQWLDALVVCVIVALSVVIGYRREFQAQRAIAALRARIRAEAQAVRDGHVVNIPAEEVVPGDVVLLSAGSLVPADAVVLEATDCYVSEAVLTGESFPTSKRARTTSGRATLAERVNCVFLGTNVRSGLARCLVVRTGKATQFGRIAERLVLRPPETEFDRGIRRFGYLLTVAMSLLVLVVFAVHTLNGRPTIETLLFSIALAVGLSPELLPAILSINLARGAKSMAARGVLVRRLNSIENLGSIDILCTDKTGTLTEGVVQLEGSWSDRGEPSQRVLDLASLNATSANLGNTVSMALAPLFIPFLPLLASQILLNNLLSDVPAMGIAEDNVDAELVARPERWDMRFIGRFMVEFGAQLAVRLRDLLRAAAPVSGE